MTFFYFVVTFSEVFSASSQECQVTTTTLKPCGEVFVENSQISRGKKGPRGIQGLPGPQGVQGVTGNRGIPGVKGEKGESGVDYNNTLIVQLQQDLYQMKQNIYSL